MLRINSFLRSTVRLIAGSPTGCTLENRLFSSLALLNGTANTLGSTNYIDGLLDTSNVQSLFLFSIHLGSGLLLLSMYLISRLQRRYRHLFWPFILSIFAFLFVNVLFNAGSHGGAHYYLITATMIAVILAPKGKLSTAFCFLLGIGVAMLLFWIEYHYPEKLISFASREERFQDVPGAFVFMQILNGILVLVLRMHFAEERDKSEKLLLNILPHKIAEELKVSDRVTPVNYENASVLFTDFVGFTRYAENLKPSELVQKLDGHFRSFDAIASKYNMEKIKTIGDAYMAVGGLPEKNASHPVDAILTAMEIKQYMQYNAKLDKEKNMEPWRLRLGIHTGNLVAGVIGEKKFAYDVWGDAVNIASRMESSSEPDKINISKDTNQLVQKYFQCVYRGEIEAKNKGKIQMFFVKSLHAIYAQDLDGQIPNETFWNEYNKLKSKTVN